LFKSNAKSRTSIPKELSATDEEKIEENLNEESEESISSELSTLYLQTKRHLIEFPDLLTE